MCCWLPIHPVSPGDIMAVRLINELSGVQARMSQFVVQRKIPAHCVRFK